MADAIRFLLGQAPCEVPGADPNLTVLAFLREQARLTGTKEGCAEGDCGACTVVLGELDGARLRYRAVNACILFLPQIDGKQLLTVEHLRRADGALHPVQQALVDSHGSQCGFCTPGFVMALFALYQRGSQPAPPDRAAIEDALAGNLCRCTGYRPIVAAAEQMHALGARDEFSEREAEVVRQLRAWQRPGGAEFAGEGRRWLTPRSLAGLARACLAHPEAHLVAGATDVGLWVTKQQRDLATVIEVGRVEALRTLEEAGGELVIGAALPYADAQAAIAREYPDFGELIRRLGSEQIRNSGTMGGNIANGSPIGDSMPALMALGASVELRRGEAVRRLALEDFYTGYRATVLQPGEFVAQIRLPLPAPGLQFRCYKIAKRFDQDISALLGAFALRLDGGRVAAIRIAFGGMAALPKRALTTERALLGRPWQEASLAAAGAALARDFQPISDMRASAGYRLAVARNLLRKLYLETAAPGLPVRVLAPPPSAA